MLHISNLYKELPEFSLKDICLSLPKGYIMGLVGINASGKSTLIKTICNIYHKDSGNIMIDGLSMDEQEAKIKNKLGIVLTENFYETNFSLEKNAIYFGNQFERHNHDVFLHYCRRFQLDPKKKLRKLSKGQQMKFQIAFALSHEATFFIMDEPTGNLDQAFRLEFMQILQELIEDGERSVLLSTHQTDTLDQIADYVTMIDHGEIIFTLSKEELNEQYRLVSGDEDTIFSLPSPIIVHRVRGQYNSMAMIYNPDFDALAIMAQEREEYRKLLDESKLNIMSPTIEELMFFIKKGGKFDVEANTCR